MKSLVLGISLLLSLSIFGQHTDFGHWYEAKASTRIVRRTDLNAELGLRFMGPGSQLNRNYAELSINRKLNDFLRADLAWRWGGSQDDDLGFVPSHRWSFGFRVKESFGAFDLSWRTRYQTRPKVGSDEGDIEFRSAWRNRIQASTKLMKKTWLSSDLEFFTRKRDEGFMMADWRVRVRVKRKLAKRVYGSIGGLYQRELNTTDASAEAALLLSVQWEWKRKTRDESKP